MNNNMSINELQKNLELHKIKIYEQKIIIEQLKNKLYQEEEYKKFYISKLEENKKFYISKL